MKPLFSIITVCYNSSEWLERTIRSIDRQTYRNIEYIIIDGGSTDGTAEIIMQYADRLSYWVSEPDGGLYEAMNKGLAKATGDYVWFINAGDEIYDKETISRMVSMAESHLPDILYGETMLVDKSGNEQGLRRLKSPQELSWKSFKWGMTVSHQSFVAKRSIAPQYNLSYRYSADVDWCIRCLKQAKDICNTHLILSRYLDEGVTTRNRKASLKERYRIMCRYYGTLPTQMRHLWFALRFYTAKLLGKKI